MQLLLQELLTQARSLSTGALTPGVNLFANTMPATPLACTCVILTGGFTDPLVPLRNPGIQILHRGTHPTSMMALANSLDVGFRDAWNTLPTIRGKIQSQGELSSPIWDGGRQCFFSSVNYLITAPRLTGY